MDCLFCKITKGEIEAKVLVENEKAVAVLDVNPRAPGHTMVLPKEHAESILDLDSGSVGVVFDLVRIVTEALNSSFSPDGFTIGINHGRAAGQAIDHLHIHIIPRWRNDGGTSIHGVVNNPPKDSLDQIQARIKSFLKNTNLN